MSRLIDADELNELMYHEAFETDSEMQKWDSGCWIKYKMFKNNIAKCKPIEAEPVRRGHCIIHNEDNPFDIYGECSICAFEQAISKRLNYCPNCGAKMEGDEE